MLLYHFGSREGLLAAAVARIEADERAASAGVVADAASVDEVLQRSWQRLGAPDRAGEERLFFELAALAAQGTPGTGQLRLDFVEPWLAPAGDDEARRTALRLDVAVLRGLLLDLLVTGDRAAADAAFDRYRALRSGGRRGRRRPAPSP